VSPSHARRTTLVVALLCSACGEIGLTVDVSAKSGVPALDHVRVQVTQGDLLVAQTFSLAGHPLPQSVALVSKGITHGAVHVVVQGLSGTTVQAIGMANAMLANASGGPHVSIVLEPLCDGSGACGCEPAGCAASSCGHTDDGCGGLWDCTGCGAPVMDAGVADAGTCMPSTCAELGLTCGSADGGCGVTLDCGACCVPLTQAQLCTTAEAQCGTVELDDGCGTVKQVDCGGCRAGQLCKHGACCTPASDLANLCDSAGFACGHTDIVDSCGELHVMDCGGCSYGLWCAMADDGSECAVCVPEDDVSFCARQGATCGVLMANDNCGSARMADCGGCDAGVSCGADGVANQCECLPLLSGCAAGAQCCNGNCGDAGLCCVAEGGACIDDADCCIGECAQSECVPYVDGGFTAP
jgi:hypothetical protein